MSTGFMKLGSGYSITTLVATADVWAASLFRPEWSTVKLLCIAVIVDCYCMEGTKNIKNILNSLFGGASAYIDSVLAISVWLSNEQPLAVIKAFQYVLFLFQKFTLHPVCVISPNTPVSL